MPNFNSFNEIEQEAKKNAKQAQQADTGRYAGIGNQDSTGAALFSSTRTELKAVAQELKKLGEYFGRNYKAVNDINIPDELDAELKESIKDNFGFDEFNSKLSQTVGTMERLIPALEHYADTDTKETNKRKERAVALEADEYIEIKAMLDSCMKNLDECLLFEESDSPMFRTLYSRVANTAVMLEDMTDGHLVLHLRGSTRDERGNDLNYVVCSDRYLSMRTESLQKLEAKGSAVFKTPITLSTSYVRMDDVPLFPHEPTEDDAAQGSLGDCYLLASLSAIARNDPERIRDAIRDDGKGRVTVRFYNDVNEPVYVQVEKSVPDIASFGDAPFARGALWVKMIEKAYAASELNRMQGAAPGKNYGTIDGGTADKFLRRFLGPDAPVETDRIYNITYSGNSATNYGKDETDDFDTIKKAVDDGVIITGATRTADTFSEITAQLGKDNVKLDNKSIENADSDSVFGIFPEHAYTVTGTKEINNKKYVILRNPHGSDGIIINSNGKPEISKDKNTAGEVQVELRNFRMLFSSFSTVKTNLSPSDRTKLLQAADFRKEYGSKIKQLANQIKSTEHIFGLSFGDSPQFTRLSTAAKRLCTAIDAEPPAMGTLDKYFRDFAESAREYREYRDTPPKDAREAAAKREKDLRKRSIDRLAAVDGILALGNEYTAAKAAADAVQPPVLQTLDEQLDADKPLSPAKDVPRITAEDINKGVQRKRDELLKEDIGSFTAETAERTLLAMQNPRFKELRYLLCKGDPENSGGINTALLEARAMLCSGHTVEDLRKTELTSNPVTGQYLDLIAETVSLDEREKENDLSFVQSLLKDVLPEQQKAPVTEAAEPPRAVPSGRTPAEEARLNEISGILSQAISKVNTENEEKKFMQGWLGRDEEFRIPQFRKTEVNDGFAAASHVNANDRPARREMSMKAASLLGRMDGRYTEALNITKELVGKYLKDESLRKANEYIDNPKNKLKGFLNTERTPEAALENLDTVNILANGTEQEKRELIIKRMSSLGEQLNTIPMNPGRLNQDELFPFIEKNFGTLNAVNTMRSFLSGKEGQHSGVSLDEITKFRAQTRESNKIYCSHIVKLKTMSDPLYQYIDTDRAKRFLKDFADKNAETLKTCQANLDALPQNGRNEKLKGSLIQQKTACLAAVSAAARLTDILYLQKIDSIDSLRTELTDINLKKQTALIYNSRNFKAIAENYHAGVLLKQENGKTVIDFKEADNLIELCRKQDRIDSMNRDIEAEQKKAENPNPLQKP